MTRPPLEVADLVRAAGEHSSNETASGSVGSMSKCCGPLLDVVPLHSAVISMSAPAADIVPPSLITAAVIAIARSVRPPLGNAGSLHANSELLPYTLPPCGLHPAALISPTGVAEQEGPLRSPVPHRAETLLKWHATQTSWRGDWLLQRVAHLEPEAQHSSACPLCSSCRRPLIRSHPLGSLPR